jgi:hypothetical protein
MYSDEIRIKFINIAFNGERKRRKGRKISRTWKSSSPSWRI